MKRSILFLSVTLMLLVIPTYSQTIYTDSMKVSVPYAFTVNGTVYPAGEYTLRLNGPQDTVMIGNKDQWLGVHSLWNVPRTNQDGKTRLVFVEQDGTHILHQIWIAGQDHGHDLLHEATPNDVE